MMAFCQWLTDPGTKAGNIPLFRICNPEGSVTNVFHSNCKSEQVVLGNGFSSNFNIQLFVIRNSFFYFSFDNLFLNSPNCISDGFTLQISF